MRSARQVTLCSAVLVMSSVLAPSDRRSGIDVSIQFLIEAHGADTHPETMGVLLTFSGVAKLALHLAQGQNRCGRIRC